MLNPMTTRISTQLAGMGIVITPMITTSAATASQSGIVSGTEMDERGNEGASVAPTLQEGLVEGSIVQPELVTTTYSQVFGNNFAAVRFTFDQSGLSSAYESGVTDFNAFIATTVHNNSNSAMMLVNSNGLNQPNGIVEPGGTITLDLGGTLPIDAVGVWATRVAPELMSLVALHADTDAELGNGGSTFLGTYEVDRTNGGVPLVFPTVETRFVHIEVLEHGGGSFLRAGEFAARIARTAAIVSNSGLDAGSILEDVNAFRDVLGELNPPQPGSLESGRREVNWDGVPDQFATPSPFPGDFFNGPDFPRARGVEFVTPGTEFQVSATLKSGITPEFGNLAEGADNLFEAFSPERLFAPLGSTSTIVAFFVPGTNLPATSRGFGAVFTDVNVEGSTTIEFFDVVGGSLGKWDVPAEQADFESFSFLGIAFAEPIVASVRIVSGTLALDGDAGKKEDDVVVMDDFIFGEPAGLCLGDVRGDGDGGLDLADLGVLVEDLNCSGDNCDGDFTGDGMTNLGDFAILQNSLGITCE